MQVFFAQPLLVHHQTIFWTDNSYTEKKKGAICSARYTKGAFLEEKKMSNLVGFLL
jgi:hypothetical protein